MGRSKHLKEFRTEILLVSIAIGLSCIIIFGKFQTFSLGDGSYYTTNGQKILSGVNVYEQGFRSGSFGAVFLYLVSKILTNSITEIFFQLSNVMGPLLLVSVITKQRYKVFKFWPLLVLIAPSRELLVNHQINGFLYLLITIWLVLINSKFKYANLVSIPFATIALDLKPHLIIPILLTQAISKKRYFNLLHILFFELIMHLIIDLRLKTLSEIYWIKNLTSLSSTHEYGEWYENYNVWPLIDKILLPTSVTKILAVASFGLLLFMLPIISRKKGVPFSVAVAFASPIVGLYCHLYDLAPFVVLAIFATYSNPVNVYFWAFLNMSIIFHGPQGIGSWVILLVINLTSIVILKKSNYYAIKDILSSSLIGFGLYFILTRTVMALIQTELLLRSSLIGALVLLGVISIGKTSLKKDKSL